MAAAIIDGPCAASSTPAQCHEVLTQCSKQSPICKQTTAQRQAKPPSKSSTKMWNLQQGGHASGYTASSACTQHPAAMRRAYFSMHKNGPRLPWPHASNACRSAKTLLNNTKTWLSMPLHTARPKQGRKNFIQGHALFMGVSGSMDGSMALRCMRPHTLKQGWKLAVCSETKKSGAAGCSSLLRRRGCPHAALTLRIHAVSPAQIPPMSMRTCMGPLMPQVCHPVRHHSNLSHHSNPSLQPLCHMLLRGQHPGMTGTCTA